MHDNVVYPRADSPTQQQQQVMVIHVRPNEPGTDAAPHTFTTEMIMACFVLWCCNCAFGVIAFILASQYTNFVPHSFHRVIHKIIPFVWNVLVIVIFSNQNKENNRVSAFLTQTPYCYCGCSVLSFFFFLFHFYTEICAGYSSFETSAMDLKLQHITQNGFNFCSNIFV